jgi:RNA polymerase sigma-32 factor
MADMRAALPQTLLDALSRPSRLTPREEYDLLCRVREGDRGACERLVLSQLRFVVRIARRYRRHGCPMPDLVQEGLIGLMEAIRRFNPERGVRLSTFAMWWIRSAIQDYVIRSAFIVRLATTPRHRAMFFNGALRNAPDRNRIGEIAEQYGTSAEDVRGFTDRLASMAVSPGTPPGRDIEFPLADAAPDPETRLATKRERLALLHRLRAAIPALTRRERHILRRRFFGETRTSLTQIGRELGLSKERVRQLEARALAKMRAMPAPGAG